ncbi:FCPF [Symbiodinium pilosum]|uniref:FCPF protein n=1 Tax=Symbiodinium pilosum TaxID=2952 RepID=A0A812LJU9_SYMPI|nr:FCPF [Symbiodinium pilosum]
MASVKSMLAAGLLAAPCADAFVAPGNSQVQGATLRGSTGVQSESCFGAKSALAAASTGAVALSFIGAQRPVARKQKVVCNFSKESQIGAMDPLGYFDPLDLCKDEATFKDFRAKEIKHGRLAMMGALGMLTQSLVQLPGFEGVPKDVSACTVGAGQTGFLITIAIIAVLEATVFVQDDSKEPGNFGNPLPLVGDDYSDEMRARELNNGRIAMFAAIGQIAAGLYTGKSGIEQFGA